MVVNRGLLLIELSLNMSTNSIVHLDLFSGIGGFSLAVNKVWPGAEHIFCEIGTFPRKILRKHWPGAKIYEDIRDLNGKEIGTIDILSAGVPCQPASIAGKRRGTKDDRWLWPESLRILRETKPTWAIFENPYGILTLEKGLVFEGLLLEMEGEGYAVQSYIIPACAVGAPHKRDRVWIVAHASNSGTEKVCQREKSTYEVVANGDNVSDPAGIGRKGKCRERKEGTSEHCKTSSDSNIEGLQGTTQGKFGSVQEKNGKYEGCPFNGGVAEAWRKWPTQSPVCGRNDGIPNRIHRLRALGNAIVPQVAEELFRHIKKVDEEL